ncbi:MAG: cation:proton antiporter [Candidatus Eisenbacteria bacterium]
MVTQVLVEILFILGLAALVGFLFSRLRLPAVAGYLLAGVLAGSDLLRPASDPARVEFLAEIGIILLLFTIGLEFSFSYIRQIKSSILLGGSLQVALTACAGAGFSLAFGFEMRKAIFFGFLLALSSTAIVLRVLQEKGELSTPHGRSALGILIFQDMIVIPIMIFIPFLAGGETKWEALAGLALRGLGAVVVVVAAARWVVPPILHGIARTRSRELFLLSVLVICFSVTLGAASIGLSLALGAFLAGLIISESEFRHHTLGNVLPFRDVFASFFFISIGMLIDVRFLLEHWPMLLLIAGGVMLLKTLIGGAAVAILGTPLSTALLVGMAIGQVGEFSFILSQSGAAAGLITGEVYQMFLAMSVLTMMVTPFLIASSRRIEAALMRTPMSRQGRAGRRDELGAEGGGADHLLIVGFGVNGRNVAAAARQTDIPYAVIEMNPDTVRAGQEAGEPLHFGDAAQETVLRHAGAHRARVAVVAINDAVAARRIARALRSLNRQLTIIVRTPYVSEICPLRESGADEVVSEEFETSIEIIGRVLEKYQRSRETIANVARQVREAGYGMPACVDPGLDDVR